MKHLKNQLNSIHETQYFSITQQIDQNGENLINRHQRNRQNSTHKKQRFLKLICIAFLISGFLSYRFGNNLVINTNCILDVYQQYTFNINRKLAVEWDNVAIGIGQIIMDGWIVASAIFWMIRIQNFRLPATVSLFYLVRSIFLLIEKFPYPQFMVWHNPGFMSLTVPYDHTRDFFYSGHTGAMTIIMLQFSQLTVRNGRKASGYVWMFAFFCLVYMMNMLIITRVHYTADIVGGLIFSVYFYWGVSQQLKWLDKLASLPYSLVIRHIVQRIKTKRQQLKTNTLQESILNGQMR